MNNETSARDEQDFPKDRHDYLRGLENSTGACNFISHAGFRCCRMQNHPIHRILTKSETSARIEGESGLSAKQKVLAVYPDATIARDHHSAYYAFTKKGAGGRISEHVGSAELVWESAASKLPKPEPKVGESGLSDEQFVKQEHPHAYCDRVVGADVIRVIIDGKGPSLSKDCSTCEEAWADARARIEAKPEPLPNTLQEEQFQQWLKTSGYKSESATCIFLMHQAWKAAAPKVVDSKEEQCLAKQLELSIPGATSGTLIIIKAAVDVELKKRFPDAETFKPKVEEQDGEQERGFRYKIRIDTKAGFRTTYGVDTQEEVSALLSMMDKGEVLISITGPKSVAPPSLPTQEFEEWFGDYDTRFWDTQEIIARAAWNASRAAAPVALPTHQIVERTIQDGRIACLQCSCGRYFIGLSGEALAWASFEAHLPEKEGK